LFELNQKEEAAKYLDELLAQHPDLLPAHLYMGMLAYGRGDYQASLPYLNRATKGRSTKKAAFRLLATVYSKLNQPKDAAWARDQEKKARTDVPWPDSFRDEVLGLAVSRSSRLKRALQLVTAKRTEEALLILRDLVHDFPDDSQLYVYLGRPLLELNEFEEAKAVLRKALDKSPDLVEANFNYGLVLAIEGIAKTQNTGNPEHELKGFRAAAPYFTRTARLKPDHARAHYMLGEYFNHEHRQARAIAAYRTAIICKPEFADAHTMLADLLIAQGEDVEALLHLGYALTLTKYKNRDPMPVLKKVLARSTLWK
jgi:tetratricopeptide (TPR) repeat protein